MSQTDTTQAACPLHCHDDDDALDSWLASLQASEFEHILSRLADEPADVLTTVAG